MSDSKPREIDDIKYYLQERKKYYPFTTTISDDDRFNRLEKCLEAIDLPETLLDHVARLEQALRELTKALGRIAFNLGEGPHAECAKDGLNKITAALGDGGEK